MPEQDLPEAAGHRPAADPLAAVRTTGESVCRSHVNDGWRGRMVGGDEGWKNVPRPWRSFTYLVFFMIALFLLSSTLQILGGIFR